MSPRRRPDPVSDIVVAGGNIGRSARPSKSFITTDVGRGRPLPTDPTSPTEGRLRLVPAFSGDARGDDALSSRAAATVSAAADWLGDLDLRCAMTYDLASGGAEASVVAEAIGAEVDMELNDGAHDLRFAAHGVGRVAMSDAAGRIEACRSPARRIVPLDARSIGGWSQPSAARALIEVRGEITEARRAIGVAAAALGVEDVEVPPDPEDQWWRRAENCSIELGHAARNIEAATVTRRRQIGGQTALVATLAGTANELRRLAVLADDLRRQSTDDA